MCARQLPTPLPSYPARSAGHADARDPTRPARGSSMERSATLISRSRTDFLQAWRLQRSLVQERIAGHCPDTLLLLEHDPVFTIGRSGRDSHCHVGVDALASRGFPVYYVERGGSVTYHGPGQLVGYPILHLRSYCAGPKTLMRLLEDVIIRVLAEWNIPGRRIDTLTGVWVGEGRAEKIASMGVRVARGVTMHGFSLNVNLDLEPFNHIVPCGIPGCRVTSMARYLGQPVDLLVVRARVAEIFGDVFGLRWNVPTMRREDESARTPPGSRANACDEIKAGLVSAGGRSPVGMRS